MIVVHAGLLVALWDRGTRAEFGCTQICWYSPILWLELVVRRYFVVPPFGFRYVKITLGVVVSFFRGLVV